MDLDDREKIEIFISGRSLKISNFFSSFSCEVAFFYNHNSQWIEFQRTEKIFNEISPNFVKTIIVDFIFEVQQNIKLELKSEKELIGSSEFTLSKLVGSKNQTLILDILTESNQNNGKIALRYEKVENCNEYLITNISGQKIKNFTWFWSNSSPFLRFYK